MKVTVKEIIERLNGLGNAKALELVARIEANGIEQPSGEPVGTICLTPVVFNHDANIFECVIQYELPHKPKQGDILYTAPPSIDALIAELDVLRQQPSEMHSDHEKLLYAIADIADKYRGRK
jgi:hypothetical protein